MPDHQEIIEQAPKGSGLPSDIYGSDHLRIEAVFRVHNIDQEKQGLKSSQKKKKSGILSTWTTQHTLNTMATLATIAILVFASRRIVRNSNSGEGGFKFW